MTSGKDIMSPNSTRDEAFAYFESTAIVLVALTGIVLYSLTWSPFGIPVSEWILSISWFFASMINMDGWH